MPMTQMDIDDIVRSGRKGRKSLAWLFWLAIFAVGSSSAWYWWTDRAANAATTYETVQASLTPIIVTVTATGTVEPTNLVEISSELSGTIRSVDVDFNSPVVKGQVLARLDTDKLDAALEHARATLAAREARVAEAQATLDETSDNFDRMEVLDLRGVVTLQDFLAAKAAFARAAAALKSAEADVRVAGADLRVDEANLAKACICSSINGVILDRNVDVGQIVASSLQAPVLFTIAEDLTHMELRADIDEADIGKVKIGNAAEFTVEAYQNRRFPAAISELRFAPQTIDGVVTYKAILSIDNADLLLRPGMTATTEIIVAKIAEALTVPNAALRFSPPVEAEEDTGGSGLIGMLIKPPSSAPITQTETTNGGLRTIWTLNETELVSVRVRTGETDGTVTEIIDGDLKPGDAVVVDVATQ